jgi:rubrerythrin
MSTHSSRTRLAAVFTALLAACSGRDIPGEDASASDPSTDDTASDPSTSGESPTTTASSDPTTVGTATSEPPNPSDPTTASSSDPTNDPTFETNETNDPDECVYADHFIYLTPEEYDQWLHGEATGTDGTDTDSTDTTGGQQGDTTGDTGTDGTTDGGTTSADDGWSWELCLEICVALAGASEWNILECDKTGALDPEGKLEIKCVEILQHCDGRSHACITSHGAIRDDDPVAAHLARAAHDEAASVHAFAALHAELAAAGAPPELLTRIRSAAADEVRHAQAVAALAAGRGAACRPPTRAFVEPRSLHAIAVENAIEGCVRETWAALLAAHQATWAGDPHIRRTMRTIAADEARHAELAWAIDAWLRSVLTPEQWTDVEAARTAAARAVIAGVTTTTPAPDLVAAAGLPDRARATRLVHGLAGALWAAA